MKGFLEEVANEILFGFDKLKDVEIIVPNRRTELFLKKAIASMVKQTMWMPKVITIQEIFNSSTSLYQPEELILIYNLYDVFKKNTITDESFDDFYYWGEIILNDFDDIDKYLVDAEKLFSTIKDIKEIDKNFDGYDEKELEIIKRFWVNINQANISIQKEKFLSLWEKMYNIYSDFQNKLKSQNIAYQGMLYKLVINNLTDSMFDKSKYLIVGFNALNKCEKALFDWLKLNKEVFFFWDADEYYLEDTFQEAGRFLRDNIRKYKPFKNIGIVNRINVENKNIEIITAPSPVSQVKIIDEILYNWTNQSDYVPEKTAIVLGDENLLIPLMYSIPHYIKTYNVSMGFPVKNSATMTMVAHLVSLQKNSRISDTVSRFYFKDVLSIVNHSFVKCCFQKEAEEIENKILKNKLIYIDASELYINDFFSKIFCCKYLKVLDISLYMFNICSEFISQLASYEDFAIEIEFLNKVFNRISVLHECIYNENVEINKSEIYFKLLNNSIKSLNVAFEGEPLEGLQILGFLETRCLDFDRVIMLSINEGIFPKNTSAQTLIPYNLRKFYELPSIEFQDSIFAYYFYRIIQRAKEVKIVYSSQASDSPSEASRFISQIKYEFDKSINLINFRNDGYKININSKSATYATKTEIVLNKIKEHFKNGISPKAINDYLNCKFKYYLGYIENIKEPDKIEEQEDGAFFGRLFHQIIYNLYENYIGRVLDINDFNLISDSKNIKVATFKALKTIFNLKSDLDVEKYYNKVIVDIVLKYVKRLIEIDIHSLPFTLIALEAENEFYLSTNAINVRIKGIIDRIDLKDGVYRVLDYKTGFSEMKALDIETIFNESRDTKYNSITQVFLYALMIDNNDTNYICPGIINVNELNLDSDYRIILEKNPIDRFSGEVKDVFKEKLNDMFSEMLDENINFSQTNKIDTCKYCAYSVICNKK